ncbi:MAG: copper homeostasis protein CutC [Flavobacteriaceae bacterium]
MRVEVCANSLQSALNAEKGGADRIELCSELGVGGVTPSYGLLKMIREQVKIPVHVLIRPRSGDFTYSKTEFEVMLHDIRLCVELGFDGIVSGILNNDFTMDRERTAELIEASGKLAFTFHRAFDWVKHPLETFQELENLKVDYVLSSGQKKTAQEGLGLLGALLKRATHTVVMPGGGVGIENAAMFKAQGFKVIHLSGTKMVQNLAAAPKISMNSMRFLQEGTLAITDMETIQKVVAGVK